MLFFSKIGANKKVSNFVVYIIKFFWFNPRDAIYNIYKIRYIKSPWFNEFDQINLTAY